MATSKDGYLWTPTSVKKGLDTTAVVQSSATLQANYDAIVIGAGFAGLVAARELSHNTSAKVLLIEARDRIGGRTWTAQELGEQVEMGGTWVHWNQPHVYAELHRYQLHKSLKPTLACLNPEAVFHNFGAETEEFVDDTLMSRMEEVSSLVFTIDRLTSHDLMPYPHDPFQQPCPWVNYDHLSLQDRLDQLDLRPQDRAVFESYTALFGCITPAETGFVEALRWYALCGHSMAGIYELTSLYKLGDGGMTSFAKAILDDCQCDLLFNSPIKGIRQASSRATVVTADGKLITARAVVSTIPLNCLSDIQFTPPIGRLHTEAAVHGQQNKGGKVHFKLARPEPLWFGTASVGSFTPYLLAFADHTGTKPTGPDGTYCVTAVRSDTIRDLCLAPESLASSFNKTFKPDNPVTAMLTHDWTNDPFAKGQWSCWSAGAMSKYLPELQRSHGKVFFASSDWASGWRGFIDGAIESGKTAASHAKELLRTEEYRMKL